METTKCTCGHTIDQEWADAHNGKCLVCVSDDPVWLRSRIAELEAQLAHERKVKESYRVCLSDILTFNTFGDKHLIQTQIKACLLQSEEEAKEIEQ
jgi:hypothetical protein